MLRHLKVPARRTRPIPIGDDAQRDHSVHLLHYPISPTPWALLSSVILILCSPKPLNGGRRSGDNDV